jgi:hypothetical protein
MPMTCLRRPDRHGQGSQGLTLPAIPLRLRLFDVDLAAQAPTFRVMRLVNDAMTGCLTGPTSSLTSTTKPRASDHQRPWCAGGGRIRFSPGDGYLYVNWVTRTTVTCPKPKRMGRRVNALTVTTSCAQ